MLIVRYIPEWVPGAGFKRLAREWAKITSEFYDKPFAFVKHQMVNGSEVENIRMPLANPLTGQRKSQIFVLDRNLREICRRRTWGYSEAYCGYFIRRRCRYGECNIVSTFVEMSYSFKTVSSIATFILAMVLYPDVLRRAQQEIDRVVGNDRLPSFKDRENLPYIDALCKEVFRWENVVPVGSCYNPNLTLRRVVDYNNLQYLHT